MNPQVLASFPDGLHTLAQAAKELSGLMHGRGVSLSTMFRWTTKGIRGSRPLQFVQCGGTRCVTREHLEAFFAGPEPAETMPQIQSPAARRKAIAAADRELDRMGV